MAEHAEVRLNLTPDGLGSIVEVNGKRMPGVYRVEVDAEAGCVTTVKLHLYAEKVEVVGKPGEVIYQSTVPCYTLERGEKVGE